LYPGNTGEVQGLRIDFDLRQALPYDAARSIPGKSKMNVSGFYLPDELADFVQQQVATGVFPSEGEVVRAGLQLLREREQQRMQRLAELKSAVQQGLDQLNRGESTTLTDETLDGFFDDVKQRGRDRLHGQQS
jgi:antitoxin ParD1/3/4